MMMKIMIPSRQPVYRIASVFRHSGATSSSSVSAVTARYASRMASSSSNDVVVTKWNHNDIKTASTTKRQLSSQQEEGEEKVETVPITYIEADGSEKLVQAPVGMNLMEVAHENDIELEGACGGELACSTCHLIFEQNIYDTLPPMEDDEVDMLDLAFEVTDTSRLGCQILVRPEMAGMKVRIPDDGF